MDNLKDIWKQLQEAQDQLALHLDVNKAETIYQQIEKEERLRKKAAPWLPFYLLGIMGALSWVVYQTSLSDGATFGAVKITGLLLITIGGICITYLTYLAKIPVGREYFDQQVSTFLQSVKEALTKRRKLLFISMSVFMFSLIAGLHLLIFGLEDLGEKGGYLGWFYGSMLALTAAAIPLSLSAFDKHYEEIHMRIERFLTSS
ncbi:MAG: hypothetical protein AAGC85_14430 [Bacteroidota bacterium]